MGMISDLEKKYPEGSDITIMNTYYQYPLWEDGKKLMDDFITIVYKDNKTGKKDYINIKKPTYTYYKYKEGVQAPLYNQLFEYRDKLEPVEVPFQDLEYSIAQNTNNVEFYKNNLITKNKAANKRLHMEPNIFFSDQSIENHYRFRFANTYTNDISPITKGFFDIEVDGKWSKYDFVQMGECAINCVSFMNDATNTIYTFILRDERNPLIQIFEDELKSGKFTISDIREFIDKAMDGNSARYNLDKANFNIQFYDFEIELLEDLFRTIHECSPDFIEGWNSSSFDLEYIIERIKAIGYDPSDVMCDKSWPIKVVKNYVDQKNINEPAERGDWTFISGLPIWIDQEIQYASRRKSKIGSYNSFKLDDIGEIEAGVHKLDYSHITRSVTELPWLDFKTFVLYNIMDVVVQKCIEFNTNDLEYIFSKCIANNTVYPKCHRQTVYLINRMAADWYKQGYIIGNNVNKDNEKPPKFEGALVSDPLKTNDFSKLRINGTPIFICDNLQDFDFKSLYPSIMGEFNIAPNTQIGKIEIDEIIWRKENLYMNDRYERGGEFIENLITDNDIEFFSRWFHLAGYLEIIADIDEFFGTEYGKYSELYHDVKSPILPTKSTTTQAVTFNCRKIPDAIHFIKDRDPNITYEKLMIG